MKSIQKSTSNDRPLSEIIINLTEKALSETSLTKSHLAELISDKDTDSRFLDHTTKHTPVEVGVKKQQNNVKKIQRYLNWSCVIPADLIKMWADSLPEAYSDQANAEIAAIFSPCQIDHAKKMKVMKELGEAVAALASDASDAIKRKEISEAITAAQAYLGDSND